MSNLLNVRDRVEEIRTTIDSKLARFDRAFFHGAGPDLSPLSWQDEFEEFQQAAVDLEYLLADFLVDLEVAEQDAVRDQVETDEFDGFAIEDVTV